MEVTSGYYREKIRKELERRCSVNPRYSMRAFARALCIDVGALSRVLSHKQTITIKTAEKITDRLNMDPSEKDFFLISVMADRKNLGYRKNNKNKENNKPVGEMDEDIFRVVSEIHHFAILELTYLKEFTPNPKWIAKKLGITEIEAKLSIERLTNLGLLKEDQGTLVKTDKNITTANKSVTTPALRKHQKDILLRSIHSLENDSLDKRSMNGCTIATNPKKLEFAKKMINEFIHNLAVYLEDGEATEVYQLGIGLFPLTKQ